MSKKKGPFKSLQARKQQASKVAVLRVPNKPRTPAAYAPMLERLATLGLEVDDPELAKKFEIEFARKMEHFRSTCGSFLENAIKLHAKRFAEEWYEENDHGLKECGRMTIVVTYGIYLAEAMESLYEKAIELRHTGVFALFNETLKLVRPALSEEFYELSTEEATRKLMKIQLQLFAALRTAGLSDKALEPKQAFLATRDEAIRRVQAAMDRMHEDIDEFWEPKDLNSG